MRSAPTTSSKEERGYDTQDSTANPLKWVHDQTIRAQVGPPAELRPGRSTDALPGWHVHKGPVDAAGQHAIKESSDKDTDQDQTLRSRWCQVLLASFIRSIQLVAPFSEIVLQDGGKRQTRFFSLSKRTQLIDGGGEGDEEDYQTHRGASSSAVARACGCRFAMTTSEGIPKATTVRTCST